MGYYGGDGMERMKRLGFLEVHELFLTTGGPLFVGDGRILDARHWVRSGDVLQLLDPEIFGARLLAQGLLPTWQAHQAAGGTAADFLEGHPDLGDISDLTARSIPLHEGAPVDRLRTFLRRPDGCPYVPGSTVKGALRNVLMVYFLNEMPETEREKWRNRLRQAFNAEAPTAFGGEMRALQQAVLHTLHLQTRRVSSTLNDLMRAISIADSDSLPPDATLATTVRRVHQDGEERKAEAYEVLPPDLRVRLTLRIDIPLMNRAGLMLTLLNEALQLAQLMQERVFWEKIHTPRRAPVDLRDLYLYLGGGAGFVNKTLLYALFDQAEARDLTNALLAQTPGYDPAFGGSVAPYTRPTVLFKGISHDMGKCRITIHY